MDAGKDEFGESFSAPRIGARTSEPTVTMPRSTYDTMHSVLLSQKKIVDRFLSQQHSVGVVIAVSADKTSAYVTNPNGPVRVQAPPDIEAGQLVFLDGGNSAIIGPVPPGDEIEPPAWIMTVRRTGNSWTGQFAQGDRALIVPAKIARTLTDGDFVAVELNCSVVIKNLGKSEGRHVVDYEPLAWDQIGGCAEAKSALRAAIEYPLTHAHLYAGYGKKAARGAVLHGPPGTGKSLLGRAAATAVAGTGRDAFLYVKGPEVRSKWHGETEANIRRLFERARAHKLETGRPAVIFIDEADALLGARDTGGLASNDSVTVVPMFLAEMDGLQESSAFVLLATNLPTGLDPAITRAKRIDRIVHVPRPDRAGAEEVLRISLRGIPAATDTLVAETIELLYSDDVVILTFGVAGLGPVALHLRDVLGGATIAGIVDKAVERAIERDIESGGLPVSGVTIGDMKHAVFLAAKELANTNLLADIHAKAHAAQAPSEGN